MKDVRCAVQAHFYISVPDDATADEIENALSIRIADIEYIAQDAIAIDEYDWSVCDDV